MSRLSDDLQEAADDYALAVIDWIMALHPDIPQHPDWPRPRLDLQTAEVRWRALRDALPGELARQVDEHFEGKVPGILWPWMPKGN